MSGPKTVPPTTRSAISHVKTLVIHNSTFNLDQSIVNRQPLIGGTKFQPYQYARLTCYDDQDIHQIIDWLTPINVKSIQNDTFSKHTVGTGTWFIKHENFQEWVSSASPNVLWVKGIPVLERRFYRKFLTNFVFNRDNSFCLTMFRSIVVNHLEKSFPNQDTAIIFAFCRYNDQYSLIDILASFIKQLVQRCSAVVSIIESVYQNHDQNGTSPSQEELLEILLKSINLFNRVYIIVDALDEFLDDARDDFWKALISLRAWLLVTSRPSIVLDDAPYVDIEDENWKDIEIFIDQNFQTSTKLTKLLRRKGHIWSEIREKLKVTSKSMFLVAALQFESLKSCTTVNELRKAAGSLSSDMDDIYSSTWERIKAQPENFTSLATRATIWLTYACRPLKITELQHALAVQRGTETFDEDDIADEETIVSVCCGLITVDRESQIVRFVHFTARDFFRKLGRSLYPTSHTLITESCLSYLSASHFTSGKILRKWELEAFLSSEEHPLRDYAYHFWGFHTRSGYEEVDQSNAVSDFLERCGQYPCLIDGTDFDLFERSHIVAYYGLQDITSLNTRPNQLTSIMKFTPLVLASAQGNEEIVKALLSHNDIGASLLGENGHTALHVAFRNGHNAVVRLLHSRKEISVNVDMGDGWTAHFAAGMKRSIEVKMTRTLKYPDPVRCLKFSSDGKYIAIGLQWNGKTHIYDVRTGKEKCVLAVMTEFSTRRQVNIWAVDFSPDSKYVATGSSSGICVWDIEQKRRRAMLMGHWEDIFSLAFSPDGRFLVSGSYDNSVRIWRLRDGLSWELFDNALGYFAVCFSPDGRYIAAANSDRKLRIWHTRTGKLVDKWLAHTASVTSVAFASDGKRLLSGSVDKTIKCWDVGSIRKPQLALSEASSKVKEIFTLEGHTDSVRSISFLVDGQFLVSGSSDRSVRIWNANTATWQCTLRGHKHHVTTVGSGREFLASGSADGEVIFWKYVRAHVLS